MQGLALQVPQGPVGGAEPGVLFLDGRGVHAGQRRWQQACGWLPSDRHAAVPPTPGMQTLPSLCVPTTAAPPGMHRRAPPLAIRAVPFPLLSPVPPLSPAVACRWECHAQQASEAYHNHQAAAGSVVDREY